MIILKDKVLSSKLKFKLETVSTRTEIHTINWLIGFFCFASLVSLFSEQVPDFVRQYGFQIFLVIAMIEIAYSTGWRPKLSVTARSLRWAGVIFIIYFLGLWVLDFICKMKGFEGLASSPPARSDLWLLAVIAPLFEEMFFRDLLLRSLYLRIPKMLFALLISSLFFMIAHMTLYPGAFILGILCGVFYMGTGNLWLSILFHSVSNLSLIFFPVLFPNLLRFLLVSNLFESFYR